MTKQEKREKAIDEMERDVEEALNVPICDSDGATYGYRKTTSVPIIAARLIGKGYRKAEEVRKEIFSKLIEVSKNFEGVLPVGVLKAWAIEFGVEVEE